MADRPHIILIMTDQQRADTLGAYGDRQCQTPYLDELAEESVVFERHYTPSPLCVPARTALATGLYPHRNGAIINHWIEQEQRYGTLGRQHVTVYERLLEAGYQLGHVGVQHIRSEPPLEQRCGAATFIGSSQYGAYLAAAGLSPPKLREYRAPCPEFVDGKMICHWYSAPQAGRHPLGLEHFYDVYLARQAVELIGRAERARPLALMCMFFSPHPPLAVPEPYDRLYEPDRLELPANVGRRYEGQPASQLMNLPGFMGATISIQQWRRVWAAYLGLVTLVDDCIGQVIAALRANGFWDDALVIFSADHGEMLGSHRMFQKMCMYEEALRVPLFVKPPGSRQGRAGRRRQLSSHIDLAATICDYAGIDWPDGGDGQSLRPIVEQPDRPGRAMLFSEFSGCNGRGSFQRAVVTESHKYIYNHGDWPELYDLANDPLEAENLAGRADYRQVERRLRSALAEWMASTDDFLAMDEAQIASGKSRQAKARNV